MSHSPTYRTLADDDSQHEDSEDTSLYDDRSSDLVSADERSFDENSSLLDSAPSQSRLPAILSLKGITGRIALFQRHEKRSPLERDLVRRLDIFLMTFGCISQGESVLAWFLFRCGRFSAGLL